MVKISVLLFFIWTAFDRIKFSFNKKSFLSRNPSQLEKLASIATIGIYCAIAFDGLFSFLKTETHPLFFSLILGPLVYLVARKLRNSAIKTLGSQWNNHTSSKAINKVIALGPFQYTRHPYYTGTFLELVGYTFLFHSYRTGLLAIILFFPLVVVRALIEENGLKKKFGATYVDYQRKIGVIFSIPNFLADSEFFKNFTQIFDIIKRFGISKLVRIKVMSKSIIRYSRGYAVSRIAGTLIEVGLIDEMLSTNSVDLVKFSNIKNFDLYTLKVVCDYFSILGIFGKRGLKYSLTAYGQKLFDSSKGVFSLLYAYMPVFEALPEIIRKEKKYGVDVLRKSEFVGLGSAELGQLLPFPYAKDILRRYNLKKILDMGCGAGEFLVNFCKHDGFRGYGIDISPEVIEVARKNARINGLTSRVKFQTADVFALHKLDREFKEADVVAFMFVLHEFLHESKGKVIEVLKEVEKNFPKCFILVSEVCEWSVPKLLRNPAPVAEHHLFHKLSKQGLASLKEWREIFDKAGLQCIEERRFDLASQAYFLLASKNFK